MALPAGLYIMGLPYSPSAPQLAAVFATVSDMSPTLAGLDPGLQLTPVTRRLRSSPSFFLSHLSFANPQTAERILTELRATARLDRKGRVVLPTAVGVLKVTAAAKPGGPVPVQDTPGATSERPASARRPAPPPVTVYRRRPGSTEADMPDHASGRPGWQCTSALAYTATASDEARQCVCCLQTFLAGESLMRLKCTHSFHDDCLGRWFSTPDSRGRCPECNIQVAP